MTLELRRTCRCGHPRALHGRPRHAGCGACACRRWSGGVVVVLSVRAPGTVARVVVPDEVPEAPVPAVRRAHSAGTGGVPRTSPPTSALPAGLLAGPRSAPPPRERERASS